LAFVVETESEDNTNDDDDEDNETLAARTARKVANVHPQDDGEGISSVMGAE
jgi:hypothetical protein